MLRGCETRASIRCVGRQLSTRVPHGWQANRGNRRIKRIERAHTRRDTATATTSSDLLRVPTTTPHPAAFSSKFLPRFGKVRSFDSYSHNLIIEAAASGRPHAVVAALLEHTHTADGSLSPSLCSDELVLCFIAALVNYGLTDCSELNATIHPWTTAIVRSPYNTYTNAKTEAENSLEQFSTNSTKPSQTSALVKGDRQRTSSRRASSGEEEEEVFSACDRRHLSYHILRCLLPAVRHARLSDDTDPQVRPQRLPTDLQRASILAHIALAPSEEAGMQWIRSEECKSLCDNETIAFSELGAAMGANMGIEPNNVLYDTLAADACVTDKAARWLSFWEQCHQPTDSCSWLTTEQAGIAETDTCSSGTADRNHLLKSQLACCELLIHSLVASQRFEELHRFMTDLLSSTAHRAVYAELSETALAHVLQATVKEEYYSRSSAPQMSLNHIHLQPLGVTDGSDTPAGVSSIRAELAMRLARRSERRYAAVMRMGLSPFVINRFLPSVSVNYKVFSSVLETLLSEYDSQVSRKGNAIVGRRSPSSDTGDSLAANARIAESAPEHASEESISRVTHDVMTVCRMMNANAITASTIPAEVPVEELMRSAANASRISATSRVVSVLNRAISLFSKTSGNETRDPVSHKAGNDVLRSATLCMHRLVRQGAPKSEDAHRRARPLPEWRQRLVDEKMVRSHKFELVLNEVPHHLLVDAIVTLLRRGRLFEASEIASELVLARLVDLNYYSLSVLGSLHHAMTTLTRSRSINVPDSTFSHAATEETQRLFKAIDEARGFVEALYRRRRSVYGDDAIGLGVASSPNLDFGGFASHEAVRNRDSAALVCYNESYDTALQMWRNPNTSRQAVHAALTTHSCTVAGGVLVVDRSFSNWVRKAVASTHVHPTHFQK